MMLEELEVYSPRTLREALRILAERRGEVRVIAGGTDLLVQLRGGVPAPKALLNIYGIDELRYIRLEDEVLRIGALTSFAEIAESEHTRKHASILAEAAESIGSPQIMNKGTIGGNLGNASPAGDSIPPLYALNSTIIVQSIRGRREIPVQRFFKGYKELDLREDELIVEVRVPAMKDREDGIFIKYGLRLGDAISVVNTAIWVSRRRRMEFEDARVALGAVAPTVVRAPRCEEVIRSGPMTEERMWMAAEAVREHISPITDIRGSAEYRTELAVNLVFKGLWELVHGRET